jgi:hypothetical protein
LLLVKSRLTFWMFERIFSWLWVYFNFSQNSISVLIMKYIIVDIFFITLWHKDICDLSLVYRMWRLTLRMIFNGKYIKINLLAGDKSKLCRVT